MGKNIKRQSLVVTPSPLSNESLLGYVLRVSERNGYPTPRTMLTYAGLTVANMTTANFDIVKFAEIVDKPISLLTKHSYRTNLVEKIGHYHVLGQRILSKNLRLSKPAICPLCLKDVGYIEAHWDIELVTVCPRHHCLLLKECPRCQKPLSYLRRGLLRCDCGADLSDVAPPHVEGAVVDLSAVLVANILHIAPPGISSGLPKAQLSAMSLMTLLRIIKVLGRHYFRSYGLNEARQPELLVEKAAEVLQNWPRDFFHLLDRLEARSNEKSMTFGLCNRFENLYHSLFGSHLPGNEVKFLKEAIIEYGVNEWSGGVLHHKLLMQVPGTPDAKFITQTELARRLGVTTKTLRRFERDGVIEVKEIVKGKVRRVYANVTEIVLPMSDSEALSGASFNVDAAARFVGIPRSVLKQLRESGHYTPNYIAKPFAAYHELDLKKLVNNLMEKCPTITIATSDQKYISFGYIMKHLIPGVEGGKADIVRDYLSGRLKAVGRITDTVEGICFERMEIAQYLREKRFTGYGKTRSRAEAAGLLHCHGSAITDLIEKGLLVAETVSGKPRVTEQSMDYFRKQYISLAEISAEAGIYTVTLQAACRALNIPLLMAERKEIKKGITNYQAFILIGHIPTLLQHFQ